MIGRISTDRLVPAKPKDKQLCLGGRDPQPLQYLGIGQRPVPCETLFLCLLASLPPEEDTSTTDHEVSKSLVLLVRQNERSETRQEGRKHDRFEDQDLEVNVNSRVPERPVCIPSLPCKTDPPPNLQSHSAAPCEHRTQVPDRRLAPMNMILHAPAHGCSRAHANKSRKRLILSLVPDETHRIDLTIEELASQLDIHPKLITLMGNE